MEAGYKFSQNPLACPLPLLTNPPCSASLPNLTNTYRGLGTESVPAREMSANTDKEETDSKRDMDTGNRIRRSTEPSLVVPAFTKEH